MRDNSKPRYAREIAREFKAGLVLPFNGKWRGRYIWWMQALEAFALGVSLVMVWSFAGGDAADPGRPGPVWATLAAFFGILTLAVLIETEARVTERHLERGRRAAAAGGGLAIPDGYVLAYELGGQPGQLGTQPGDEPFVIVAAVQADRWDLYEPLWRFSVRPSSLGGVITQIPAGSFAAVGQLGGLVAELDAGPADLLAVERVLVARGARDLTSVHFQPPAAR